MVTYEEVLRSAGGFGRYQILVWLWFQLNVISIGGYLGSLMFMCMEPTYVKVLTRENETINLHNPPWFNSIVAQWGYALSPYRQVNGTLRHLVHLGIMPDNTQRLATDIQAFGMLCGGLCFGYISDTFGRRFAHTITHTAFVFFSLLTIFSLSWEMYLVFQFFTNFFAGGTWVVIFVLPQEIFPSAWRLFTNVLSFPFSFIYGILAAKLVMDWRILAVMLQIPAPFIVACRFYIVESPKWLIEKNNKAEALRATLRIAEINRVRSGLVRNVLLGHLYHVREHRHLNRPPERLSYQDISTVQTRPANRFALVLFLVTFVTSMVNYGIYYNLKQLSGDLVNNAMVSSIIRLCIQTPLALCDLFIPSFGRRAGVITGLAIEISAMIYFVSAHSTFEQPGPKTQMATRVIAITCVGATSLLFAMTGVLQVELFPTPIRTQGVALNGASLRLGAFVGTYMLQSSSLFAALPYTLYLALLVFAFVRFAKHMPETKGAALPELT